MKSPVAFIFAHPDDESFLSASLIRQLADRGEASALLLATRGDAGHKNGAYAHLSRQELGALRDAEMARAAEALGLREVRQLGHPDGGLNAVEEEPFVAQVAAFIDEVQARTVVTFPPDGGNRHPDHMAISRIATAAVRGGSCPTVEQLYYVWSDSLAEAGFAPTLRLDTAESWSVKADALRAHESQRLAIERYFGSLEQVPELRRYETFALVWERGGE